MSETRYGIISDTHENPGVVPGALQVLQHLGIDKLIVNGDVGTGQDHMVYTLSQVGKTGLESYVQPGSHERLEDFEPIIEAISKKFGNVQSAFERQKVDHNGHSLVFLPGSDFLCGGEYQLLRREGLESGFYKTDNGTVRVINMNDLGKLVSDPDKTVVVSHVPRRFENGERGVDMAYFAENEEGAVIPGNIVEEKIRLRARNLLDEEIKVVAKMNGLELRRENRGNEEMKNLYEDFGIKKSVTGHFHEGVHNAHDSNGRDVKEGEYVDDLFWNASYLDGLKAGILRVRGEEMAYQNVDLSKYLA